MSPADFSIKAKIIPEIDAAMLKRQSKGLGLGGAVAAGAAGGLVGGGALGMLEKLANQFKPLLSIVRAISKLLIEFLRPIADVVMILLMPILMMLKPIVMIFRTLMAPFRALAMRLAAAGAEKLMAGETDVGMLLILEAFQTMVGPIMGAISWVIATIVDAILGTEFADKVLEYLEELRLTAEERMGMDIETLIKSIIEESEKLKITGNKTMDSILTNWTDTWTQWMVYLGVEGAKAISKAIAKWKAAIEAALDETLGGEEPTIYAGAIGIVPSPVIDLANEMDPTRIDLESA